MVKSQNGSRNHHKGVRQCVLVSCAICRVDLLPDSLGEQCSHLLLRLSVCQTGIERSIKLQRSL